MLPPLSNFHRSVRRILGKILDRILVLEYLYSTLINSRKNTPEIFHLIPESSVVFYSAYLRTAEEFEIICRQVVKDLADFDHIFIINTGTHRPDSEINSNLNLINRENYGRDFGSLQDVIQKCGKSLQNISELLILNDSVYWRPGAVKDYISQARTSSYTVTGLTSSYQHHFHLQSYALHFKTIDDNVMKALNGIQAFKTKRTVVAYGEKKLSKTLEKNGLSIGSLYDPREMQQNTHSYQYLYGDDLEFILGLTNKGVQLNPTIHFWPELALSAGVIKKSLLKNPAKFSQSPIENRKLLELLAGWGFKGL